MILQVVGRVFNQKNTVCFGAGLKKIIAYLFSLISHSCRPATKTKIHPDPNRSIKPVCGKIPEEQLVYQGWKP